MIIEILFIYNIKCFELIFIKFEFEFKLEYLKPSNNVLNLRTPLISLFEFEAKVSGEYRFM